MARGHIVHISRRHFVHNMGLSCISVLGCLFILRQVGGRKVMNDVGTRQVFSAGLKDVIRWKADAKRQGKTFSAWVRECLNAGGKRLNGEKGVAGQQNKPRIATTPVPEVRTMTEVGTGRLGTVSSSQVEVERQRARELAQRTGKCTADVERGVRCRLCGKLH